METFIFELLSKTLQIAISQRLSCLKTVKNLPTIIWKICVLDLDHSCPGPRDGLSSKSRSLASDFFFESLALKVVSSTPPLQFTVLFEIMSPLKILTIF